MKPISFCAAICGFLAFTACNQDTAVQPAEDTNYSVSFIHDEHEDGHTNLPDVPFADALLAHAEGLSAHYLDAERKDILRPDGTTDTRYVVDGDIELTKDDLRMFQGMSPAQEKQYRTNNLVSRSTIRVIGYTGGSNALTTKMRTALQWAVDNYNALNTNKTFTLTFSSSTNADIVVYRDPNNQGAGGVAGFPSGGNPYKWVTIYSGMEAYNTNVNEHVMTHEIGHCMGLRHTDWFSRQSCGQSGESAGSAGAVHIPGTPTGYDANSIMLACFGSNEDGEFGNFDRIALETIY
ncbi:M57 family metalloprotease [Neolewinella lacunae]|uniref:Peptidase n=1 Tax=Neolewinella lacunae TaxID=1517758 RepID=A0A923T996_9BACT|nr:M57 family metalloprotease [Neolewinella lacunae]MBC6995336.1 peptidase [Neolewinella lacunae]MDN3633048.1 M57 family metalloprotease [Neolewinella lacunae]